MTLSIIIPAYNAEPYIYELLDCLDRQMTEGVEVIVVDDGSTKPVTTNYPWCTVIRKKNGGSGSARNKGLSASKGEYIAFIDADDLVADYYIDRILEEIDANPFDMCDLSWKSLNQQGVQFNYKLNSKDQYLNNPSACTRVFSRAYLGNTKFSVMKDSTEDEDFSRRVGYLNRNKPMNHTAITDYMYFYRTYVVDSQSKKFKQGLRKTKRIVHHYNHVTKEMTWLLDTIKEQDKMNEVWLLTNQNDIPELARYCQIHTPMHMWTHYVYGEPINLEVITPPVNTQIILYIHFTNVIGGIETFISSFCKHMSKKYEIAVLYDIMAPDNIVKNSEYAQMVKYDAKANYVCDTLIMLRILDKIPSNIQYKQSIRTCHACRTNPAWHIPDDVDKVVCVSETSKESFGDEGRDAEVIHNLINIDTCQSLLIVSATRIPAPDKGNNEKRMRRLAEMLNEKNIPFTWLNFSEGQISDPPKNFHNCGMSRNMQQIMRHADYVVLLSDSEAFPYAVLEALTQNTAVIVTPFPSTKDIGVVDGVNGYIVPYDMDFDVTKLMDVPQFEFEYNNEELMQKWVDLIGKPRKKKAKPKETTQVKVLRTYRDLDLNMMLYAGSMVWMKPSRVDLLTEKGFVQRV